MKGKYISLKNWARKDYHRPYGARNLYYVVHETEKAVLCNPVDYFYESDKDFTFWAPKSAIEEVI